MDELIDNKYKILKSIGKGAFGEVFSAIDIETEEEHAVKIEEQDSKHPQLHYEYKVMNLLSD
jgi:casein kinase 1, epsilon